MLVVTGELVWLRRIALAALVVMLLVSSVSCSVLGRQPATLRLRRQVRRTTQALVIANVAVQCAVVVAANHL